MFVSRIPKKNRIECVSRSEKQVIQLNRCEQIGNDFLKKSFPVAVITVLKQSLQKNRDEGDFSVLESFRGK